jgi:hypothetical protein
MNQLPALPLGYTVIVDSAVGYSYLDATGDIVFQHPYDNAIARAAVWHIHQKRVSAEMAVIAEAIDNAKKAK